MGGPVTAGAEDVYRRCPLGNADRGPVGREIYTGAFSTATWDPREAPESAVPRVMPDVVPSVVGNRQVGRFITPATFVVRVSDFLRGVIVHVIFRVVGDTAEGDVAADPALAVRAT